MGSSKVGWGEKVYDICGKFWGWKEGGGREANDAPHMEQYSLLPHFRSEQ